MTDLDPEIWDNPTLGKAAQNTRLDALEKQQLEDRNAKIEGRESREVVVDNDYPGWTPELHKRTGTLPSNATVVHFADEKENDVEDSGINYDPDTSEVVDDPDVETPEEENETSPEESTPENETSVPTPEDGESSSAESDSTEGGITQWRS